MIMKKLFLNGMAAVAMGLVVVSCSHDSDGYMPSDAEKLANASEKLGVEVDPNQDWNMTSKATANITVNGDYGETYTVKILANDPLVDGVSYVLAEGQIAEGETFSTEFEYASASSNLVVALTNHNGYTTYRSLPIVDGVMDATIGESQVAGARGAFRSQTSPAVPDITVASNYPDAYLDGAKEPTAANTTHNHDNGYYQGGYVQVTTDPSAPYFGNGDLSNNIQYGGGTNASEADKAFYNNTFKPLVDEFYAMPREYNGKEKVETFNALVDKFKELYDAIVAYAGESGVSHWITNYSFGSKGAYTVVGGTWVADEDWVLKFKIESGKEWNDYINVLATEGLTDGVANGNERTIVVKGTWNLTADQTVGSRGQVIIANGGVLNISSGKTLTLVNQSRLVVMPGGTVQGAGNIKVTNGNEEGFENYNGGTINITGTFNNNFGKFYNYNFFKCNTYEAGGQESNFYNHGVAHINNGGTKGDHYVSTNTRIFNACQWYCENSMRAYIVEMTAGSYFYVGDQLEMSAGNDGSDDPTYVAMAAGALMKVGDLRNNLTNWIGPESGWAVCEFGKISYLNWNPGTPTDAGYFINNIAVSIDDKTALNHDDYTPTYEHFKYAVANGYGTGQGLNNYGTTKVGNGNACVVEKGKADVKIDASEGFVAGQKGCTPGYNGEPGETPDPRPAVWSYAYEDTPLGDYDMNDVVLKVSYAYENGKVDYDHLSLTLCCTGATLGLKVYLGDKVLFGDTEVHTVLGRVVPEMVNTGAGPDADPYTTTIDTPANFEFGTADFWISSPLVPAGVHIAKAGQDPHGVVIPADWAWPVEYCCIKDAYPNFIEFAKDASTTDETILGWYKKTATNPVAGKTYKQ